MSLSFVKSAVLSSSDGISHNQEESISNPETTSLRTKSYGNKPLFEQLRSNKEAEQEQYDDFQRSLRGTRLLDEEDCAHLDAVERVRLERERMVACGIEREVALFQAARLDRALTRTALVGSNGQDDPLLDYGVQLPDSSMKEDLGGVKIEMRETKRAIIPKFTIKKRKRQVVETTDHSAVNQADPVTSSGATSVENCVDTESLNREAVGMDSCASTTPTNSSLLMHNNPTRSSYSIQQSDNGSTSKSGSGILSSLGDYCNSDSE